MKDYALVATFETEFEAKLIESKLAEANIPKFLQSQHTYPPLSHSGGVKVYVNPGDLPRAEQVLGTDKDTLTDDTDTTG